MTRMQERAIEIRTGTTITRRFYWVPHVVFPNGFGPRFVWGSLGLWALGRKIELSWDFRSPPSEDR